MIRQALFAAALLTASTATLATGFGHVERHVLRPVEHLSLSIGSLLHDGFNVTYGIGGHHLSRSHRERVIVVPPTRVTHIHRHENRHRHWDRGNHRGWRNDDRHSSRWDDKRRRGDDRHDDRGGRGGRGGDRSRH